MSNYGQTDMEKLMALYEEEEAIKGMLRPKGACDIVGRILPPREDGLFFTKFGLHYNLTQLNSAFSDYKYGIACPFLTLGVGCPSCRLSARLYAEARLPGGTLDPAKQAEAKAARVATRYVVNFVNVEDPSGGVLTWEFGTKIYDKLRKIFTKFKNITDPEAGRVIVITFEKGPTGISSTDVQVDLSRQDPIPADLDWVNGLHDLDAYAKRKLIDVAKMEQLLRPWLGTTYVSDTAGNSVPETEVKPAVKVQAAPPTEDITQRPEIQAQVAKLRAEREAAAKRA